MAPAIGLMAFNRKTIIPSVFKGKIKAKKLQAMLTSLSEADLGVYGGGEYTHPSKGHSVKLTMRPFKELKPGLNEEVVVLGRVVGSVMNEDAVPL